MTTEELALDHPAPYSPSILGELRKIVEAEQVRLDRKVRVLDPMAGIGRIHELRSPVVHTVGVEIEPEWAIAHPGTIVGDATRLNLRWRNRFDLTITSPDYGNRFADSFEDRGTSKRYGYRWSLGRPVSQNSVVRQFGLEYKRLHALVLANMLMVTKPGGLIVVNVSDFYRDHGTVPVVPWYRETMNAMHDMKCEATVCVPTPRMRVGENFERRVTSEQILIYRKVQA